MKAPFLAFALAAIVACPVVAGVVACNRGQEGSNPTCTEATGLPIDTQVMAFLSAARSHHHLADLKEEEDDKAGAIKEMVALVGMPRPHPGVIVVEVEEVLADAYARLAQLRLSSGDADGALRDVNDGLEHVREPTYFRGHLLEVEGIVENAREKRLVEAGKPDEARKAHARAVELLYESAGIQLEVIQKVLGDGGVRP